MRLSVVTSAFSLLAGANLVLAACETRSFTTCDDGIVHWFDPRNGEICDPKDCGGGRAPARTDVPGCPLYSGTILSIPVSYLSCWTPSSAVPSTTSEAAVTSKAVVTSATSASDVGRTTTAPASETSTAESTVESTVESSAPSTVATTSAASASSQTSAKVPITSPATLSTKTQPTHAASSNVTSASSSKAVTSTSTSTANAGHAIGGSLMAAAGIAIGAMALL